MAKPNASPMQVIEETPGYWRAIFDYPPFNVVDGDVFQALQDLLVRNAIDTPLAEGLALERNLFMRLCVSDQALARMRSYEDKKITDPSRSLEP